MIAEIETASREQAAGIEQINKAMAQMDELTRRDAQMAQELISTARIRSRVSPSRCWPRFQLFQCRSPVRHPSAARREAPRESVRTSLRPPDRNAPKRRVVKVEHLLVTSLPLNLP